MFAKRNVCASFAMVLALTAIALFFVRAWPIRILDARFRIISVTASRGTNQPVYFESQLAGRVKESLRRIGLGGRPTKKVTLTVRDNTHISLAIVYSGKFAPQEMETVGAELEDSAGKIIRLEQGFHAPNPKGENYMGIWVHRVQSTNNQSYCLRLKLQHDGRRLAEIKLGVL